MDQSLTKLVRKVLSITHENLIIESCNKVDTFAYDEKKGDWVPNDFTLFILVKNTTDEVWNTSDVENSIFEHLGMTSVVSV